MLKYKYKFLRKERWVGVVYRVVNENSVKPITAAAKKTEDEIRRWCEETVRCLEKEGLN